MWIIELVYNIPNKFTNLSCWFRKGYFETMHLLHLPTNVYVDVRSKTAVAL